MLKKLLGYKGQSIIEYVLIIGAVMAVLVGMQVYMKRGIQGVIKTVADEVGKQSEAEDIDPFRGVITDSKFTTVTGGAPSAYGGLEAGQSMRVQSYGDGGRRTDIYTEGSTTGSSTAVSYSPQ